MIYVAEKNIFRQLDLLQYLSKQHRLMLCSWLYPESNSSSIAGFHVSDVSSGLQPVTVYGTGVKPQHTELVEATKANIAAFSKATKEIVANCDSLALYGEGEDSWYAVTIGHEGMCLVQDVSLLPMLTEAGFSASMEPPSWW